MSPGPDRLPGPGGDGAVGELRALALLVLDRLDPVLAGLRDGAVEDGMPEGPDAPVPGGPAPVNRVSGSGAAQGTAPGGPTCPVCAVLAVVRGEHPERARRLAARAAELAAVLRGALTEGDPAADGPAAAPRAARRVQHVPVDRGAGPRPRVVQRVPVERPAAAHVAVERGDGEGGTGGTPC